MIRWITNLGLLQVFCALLLVIVIMSVSNWIVYRNSISDIYEQMIENNTLAVKSMIQTFDSSFQTIDNLIYTIHNLPYNNLLDGRGNIDMSKVYSMQTQIESMVSSNDFIEDVIVFYDGVPLAITIAGTSSMEHLFNHKYRHDLYDANYWKKIVRSRSGFVVFPAEEYTVLSDQMSDYKKKKLMVIIGGNKLSVSSKNIMIMVDVDDLLKQLNQTTVIPGASLIVLDHERNFLFGTDEEWDLMEMLNDVYFNDDREATLTKENYEYHFYQSDYNGFIYIDKVPYQFQNIHSVTQANYAIIWTAIVSAVILSVLLSIYLNKPVRNILRLLGGGYSKGNDFRKIYSGILKLQTENEAYRKQLNFVDNELRRGVLLQVLDGSPHSEEHEKELLKYKPDLLRQPYFAMAAIQMDPLKPDDEPVPVETLTANLQEELRSDGMDAAVFHEKGLRFLVIFGVKQANGKIGLLHQLRQSVRRLEKESLRNFRIQGTLSKVYHSDIGHLRKAYEDLQTGIIYRPVNAREAVIDAENVRVVWNLYLPHERMEKLTNLLLAGKLSEAHAVIRETLEENVKRDIQQHQLEYLAKAMFYYMMKLADASDLDAKALLELERRFLRTVEETSDPARIGQALIEAADIFGSHSRKEQQSRLNPAFISQYIELHYMENLYLDHMAEILGTTPKYFSNYFKKTFGVNFVEYLNKVRLSHARELLRDTNLSIAEIGEKTGYLNSSTFTTTFKKYYGISPSDYRKRQLGA